MAQIHQTFETQGTAKKLLDSQTVWKTEKKLKFSSIRSNKTAKNRKDPQLWGDISNRASTSRICKNMDYNSLIGRTNIAFEGTKYLSYKIRQNLSPTHKISRKTQCRTPKTNRIFSTFPELWAHTNDTKLIGIYSENARILTILRSKYQISWRNHAVEILWKNGQFTSR